MEKIILLIFLFTYQLKSQTNFQSNSLKIKLEYFSFKLGKLTQQYIIQYEYNNSFTSIYH
jgi:hypothetical protein